ncbi:MAG TPA: DUF4303 domain-containing protein [Burkholderiaceae bacterium]
MPILDSHVLLATLRDELRAAWHTFRSLPGHERLYGFGVFTIDSAAWLMATGFSEHGLDAAVSRTLASRRGRERDPAQLRDCLRWSPADSPLHVVGAKLLPRSDAIVRALDFEARWDDDEDPDDPEFDELWDPEVLEVFQLAMQALRELDVEGLFGHGAERERLVLCIWEGDQSDEARFKYARLLNPASVARRFGAEMAAATRAYEQVFADADAAQEDDEVG